MTLHTHIQCLTRSAIAARIACDIEEGWCVNLGIGIPTLVANVLPQDREIVLHSENGILGMGPAPAQDSIDPWLVNAGKEFVTLLDGGAFISQSDSFVVVRGGHLDLCVLGAFEVAANGDIANWTTSLASSAPAVGGAMDLAAGARRIWVAMEHLTRKGTSRLTRACSMPITAAGVVSRIYTSHALLEPCGDHFQVIESLPGLSCEALQAITDAPLVFGEAWRGATYGDK